MLSSHALLLRPGPARGSLQRRQGCSSRLAVRCQATQQAIKERTQLGKSGAWPGNALYMLVLIVGLEAECFVNRYTVAWFAA